MQNKKIIVLAPVCAFIISTGIFILTKTSTSKQRNNQILRPIATKPQNNEQSQVNEPTTVKTTLQTLLSKAQNDPRAVFTDSKPLNVMILGIDRRSKSEYGFRTDTMILASANPETNKIVLISVPRDLWTKYGRINAAYITDGWEALAQEFSTITGLNITKYILTDFEDFSWVVDAMGGVEVNVPTSFVDSSYPVDETFGYQTISFNAGNQLMNGDQALKFARSRKGTNGEGSDWARMKRQHLILDGMLDSIQRPGNLFTPMNVENAYKTVTTGRMNTNLTLEDSYYLWDFYKDRDKYTIESLVLDGEFVYNPPMQEYGGAWVLVPTESNYTSFKQKVAEALALPND